MNAEKILNRLYTFFVVFGILIFVGTMVELFALRHNREEIQIIPFILLPLGILLAVLMLLNINSTVQKVTIIGMWIVALGGIFGMVIHVSGNLEGIIESGQKLAFNQIMRTVIGGRNPLLAPGTLTIGAAMILAVSYAKKMVTGIK